MKQFVSIHFVYRSLIVMTVLTILCFAQPATRLHAQEIDLSNSVDEAGIYTVQYTASWSADTHPNDAFPTNSAHFSPLIGAVHGEEAAFWNPGTMASAGIEQMAESGGTSGLRAEITDAITDGSALSVISGGGANSPGSATIEEIELHVAFPYITLVTMIAPSPDWFVGISGESLLDEEGKWVSERTVTLYPYDAGTDSGADYVTANADTVPAQPIHSLRNQAPFSDAPIGTFTFTRVVESNVSVYLPWITR